MTMAADATGFAALHPSVQYLIVNQLRWPGLRPVQELSVAPILRGDNAVVLAPTAGGKTEAAFFPALSRLLQENWAGLSILYVSPIRALLNNQGERLQNLCQALGLTAQIWHGDVTASAKKRMRQAPPNVMLTTPESLEAILVSPSRSASRMFGGLRIVVIDEVHAFAGADRGWHLLGVLNRLQQRCGHDIQRVGLSATVGNRSGIVDWLSAGSVRGRTTIDPPRPPGPEPDVVVDFVGSLENAATVIARLHAGEKRLVCCGRPGSTPMSPMARSARRSARIPNGSSPKGARASS
jgi:ATP-dependent Lhr-like helicase